MNKTGADSNEGEITSVVTMSNEQNRVLEGGLWRPRGKIIANPVFKANNVLDRKVSAQGEQDNNQVDKNQPTTSAAKSAKILEKIESDGRAVLLAMKSARQNKDKLQSHVIDLTADVTAVLANWGINNQLIFNFILAFLE